jgi:hypothetical protein
MRRGLAPRSQHPTRRARAAAGALVAATVAGCPAGEQRVSVASWQVSGAARGARDIDDRAGGRVTCTVDADRRGALDDRPQITFAALSAGDGRRQPAFYLTARDFTGPGGYHLGTGDGDVRGHAVFFDDAVLPECGRLGETRCFQATSACSLTVERWDLGDVVEPGVRLGTGEGRFECAQLDNVAGRTKVTVSGGTFTCRASDWTASR